MSGATKNLVGTKDYSLIHPGLTSTQQRIVTVSADTPAGTYVVQACADSLNVVAEASETNNCFNATGIITVQ